MNQPISNHTTNSAHPSFWNSTKPYAIACVLILIAAAALTTLHLQDSSKHFYTVCQTVYSVIGGAGVCVLFIAIINKCQQSKHNVH